MSIPLPVSLINCRTRFKLGMGAGISHVETQKESFSKVKIPLLKHFVDCRTRFGKVREAGCLFKYEVMEFLKFVLLPLPFDELPDPVYLWNGSGTYKIYYNTV